MATKDVAIYGAGGLGSEFAVLVQQVATGDSQWNLVGFFDDQVKPNSTVSDLPVFGGSALIDQYTKPMALIIAIANSGIRARIASQVTNPLISFPTIFHPSAQLGDKTNSFGAGTIITANCILTTRVKVGKFVIINLACTIGHDVVIGDFASLMPGSHISGNVTIGSRAFIGTGAVILQGISIGEGAIVGAGAVVTKNVAPGITVAGVPARPMKKNK